MSVLSHRETVNKAQAAANGVSINTRMTRLCLLLPILLCQGNAQPSAPNTSYDLIREAAVVQKLDFARLKDQASAGDLHSQVLLGIAHRYGFGTKKDPKRAAKWVYKAARAGEPMAELILGRFYSAGIGVAEDKVEALNWFRRAADHGNAEGQFELGVAYARGLGVPADESQANALYQQAAERGFGPAKCALVLNDPKYRATRGAKPPRVKYGPDPEFSEEARKANFTGTVVLLFGVGEDGKVHEACVLRPLGLGLDEKALEANRQWRFDPSVIDGRTVPFLLQATHTFTLY